MPVISHQILYDYCHRLFCCAGVPTRCADQVCDSLIDAELSGIASHGVSRVAIYLERIRAGGLNPNGAVTILSNGPSALRIDGGNNLGAHVASFAMEQCISHADETGSCFAAVCNSSHFGAAGYYARMAAEQGMIGFVCTNLRGKIAPHGSSEPYFGTNPIAIAVPTDDVPIVLDMTPSVVALGKLILAQKLGQEIPVGWALDSDGNPTTDPAVGRAGSLLPLGGPKGSGMAMIVDILSGILSGGKFGNHLGDLYGEPCLHQGVGHFMGAIDVGHFIDLNAFKGGVSQMRQEVKGLRLAEGFSEIYMPGERSALNRTKNTQHGIHIPDAVYEELQQLGASYGLALPQEDIK